MDRVPMTEKEFSARLAAIAERARAESVNLLHEAQESHGLAFDTTERLPYAGATWEEHADKLAELCGWIYDRLNGRNRTDKQSKTKKIRKALGYTYP